VLLRAMQWPKFIFTNAQGLLPGQFANSKASNVSPCSRVSRKL
jgi:hypothetical protein